MAGLSIERQLEEKVITAVGNSARRWGNINVDKGATQVVVKCNPPEEFAWGEAGECLAAKCRVDAFIVGYARDDTSQTTLDALYEDVFNSMMDMRVSNFSGLTGISASVVSFAGGDFSMDGEDRVRMVSIDVTVSII